MFTDDAFGLATGKGPLRQVLDQIDQVSKIPGGVIVCGEPGTGRGIVARAIHARHSESCAPFVAVYCDRTAGGDLERHLFGGFDPAEDRQTRGQRCERVCEGSALHDAIGGTLYFRNLEELPAVVQGRLARLLRDRECQIGSRGPKIPFDVRPVTAVDPDVELMVKDGRLRADLYRRFSTNQIKLTPLRESRSDIPALANFLLVNACQKIGIPPKTLDQAASSVLAAMPWRGNVRELMSLVETLAIKVSGDTVNLNTLLDSVRLEGSPNVAWNLGTTLREARQYFEREYIAAVVAQFHGRVPDAARSLGIQRTNLYRKLRNLHIKPEHEQKTPSRGTRSMGC